MMANKVSYTKKLKASRIYLTVALLFIVFVFFGLTTFNRYSYNEIFNGYHNLQQYYSYINISSDEMKLYLISGDPQHFTGYEEANKQALINIESILNNPIVEEKWRYDLLNNMVAEYMLSVDALLDNEVKLQSSHYDRYYDRFIKTEELIQSTAVQYYHLITDVMSAQKSKLEFLQNTTLVLVSILSIIIIAWLSYFTRSFQRFIGKPIQSVLDNISLIKEGVYELEADTQLTIEMEELCIALEEMAGKIAHDFENEKLKTELEKKIVQSELKMLQNQINPHFLFNTLNTIYCMTEKEGAYDASDMLLKTSAVLRYGLEMQNRISNVAKELEIIRCYIDIQQIRFQERVTFSIQSTLQTEYLENIAIPGMILQPIVENSIKHGLKDCEKDGKVEITVRDTQDTIVITICDNGEGVNATQLDKMVVANFETDNKESLGLYNVVHRLEMYYEDRVTIEINSDEDCGFQFVISIKK